MTFDDILAQVITLLQRQGRVSYSALKRRFDLTDDYLNDLKDELLYVHPVRDDEGRGLVWAGEHAAATPSPAPGTLAFASTPDPDHARAPLSYTPQHLAEKILRLFKNVLPLNGKGFQQTIDVVHVCSEEPGTHFKKSRATFYASGREVR